MPETKKPRILLVDDNEIIRIYFREVFWIHGLENEYELQVAEDVEKAAALLDMPETRPDIVFAGLVMPMRVGERMVTTPEAGFSLIKKIKTDPKLRNIKVIIFTGHEKQEFKDRAKELGADDYLIKHENLPQELVEFIEKLNVTANH